MEFNCDLLEKIEIGTIFYKRLGSDTLEYKETVILYDNKIFTGNTYKGMYIEECDGNFRVIAGVYGARLFIPSSFKGEPDKEEFYILLERNLLPSNSNKMQELEKKGYATQDKSEFVDILCELLLEELQVRYRVNINYDYKIVTDRDYSDKKVMFEKKKDSKDLLETLSIEDFEEQDRYWKSLYHKEARDLISEFVINLVESLEFEDRENNVIDSTGAFPQSELVKKYREYMETHGEKKQDDDSQTITINRNRSVEIIDKVKLKIVSQDNVVRKLIPVILSNSRLVNYGDSDLITTEKKNILLIGPTGVGKTAIISETIKHLGIPMVKTATTNFSGVGYVDSSLTDVLYTLINNSNKDIEKAQKGVIFFDEADKLFNSDLKIREGIVDELLSWISGTTVQVKAQGTTIDFDTSLLTFIFGGAFTYIYNSMEKNSIGFDKRSELSKRNINVSDLIKFGVKDEFAGRIGVILELNPLRDFKSLRDILVYSEISPLRNLQKYFKVFYNVNIEYGDDVIDEITNRALSLRVGARGLTIEVSKIQMKLLEACDYGFILEHSTSKLTPEMLDDSYCFESSNIKCLKNYV